jgi:hypothetical protein
MLEQYAGKVITFYVTYEDSYHEDKLVKVDANGIYTQAEDDANVTTFHPFTSIKYVTLTKG